VILDPERPVEGLADSKQLSPARREFLAGQIQERALAWSVGRAEVEEIDRLNILNASLLAMARAVAGLPVPPSLVLVDGNRTPKLECEVRAIVRGDASVAEISAASIIAKVMRDKEMNALDEVFPGYGFAVHKGYPTRQHLAALRQLGASIVHRRSFRPVSEILNSILKT